ncbi:MAG: hypothetical protein MI799_18700 [Desulfobacterales bacterium]|nr:hypothetical protein [Desulfobacterales bacterium]
MRISQIISVLLICLLSTGCHKNTLKQKIKNYSGDGKIRLIETPILGSSGCAVEMPQIDLSKPHKAEYSLKGLPDGMEYIIFLIIKDTPLLNQIFQGNISYKILKNETVIKEYSLPMSELRNSREENHNRLYYISGDQLLTIRVNNSNSHWSLIVETINPVLTTTVKASIEISAGGFK